VVHDSDAAHDEAVWTNSGRRPCPDKITFGALNPDLKVFVHGANAEAMASTQSRRTLMGLRHSAAARSLEHRHGQPPERIVNCHLGDPADITSGRIGCRGDGKQWAHGRDSGR
jgi:hypothetical protein